MKKEGVQKDDTGEEEGMDAWLDSWDNKYKGKEVLNKADTQKEAPAKAVGLGPKKIEPPVVEDVPAVFEGVVTWRGIMEKEGLTMKELADMIGMSYGAFRNSVSSGKSPKWIRAFVLGYNLRG